MNIFNPKSWFSSPPKMRTVEDLPEAAAGNESPPLNFMSMNGDKFIGGYGDTQILTPDYWTLRARSTQLYNENLYAQGIINAFVTNIINTGLTLDATPHSGILGLDEDFLNDWAEDTEARFKVFCDNPAMVDFYGNHTHGELQAIRELHALVEGDVLTVYHFDKNTFLPKIQLIPSNSIQSPATVRNLAKGNKIEYGVEFDSSKREVAYWVLKNDGTHTRVPRFGKSGRRLANLYRPGKKLMNNVRGIPLLGNVLQSLREIDRYRDSVQRKAMVASFLALAIEKDQDSIGSKPLGSLAARSTTATTEKGYSLNVKSFNPGMIIDDMPAGSKIKMMDSSGTDLSFPEFESAIINAIAWTKEVPPEVIKKSFSSNYAASKQANAEFSMFLDMERTNITKQNDHSFYAEWLYTEVLKSNIKADGLVASWSDPNQYAIKGAWLSSDWSGSIKPNADLVKEGAGHKLLVEQGFETRSRASKNLTNTKFTTNVRRLARENKALSEALRPILELRKEFGAEEVEGAVGAMNENQIKALSEDEHVSSD